MNHDMLTPRIIIIKTVARRTDPRTNYKYITYRMHIPHLVP